MTDTVTDANAPQAATNPAPHQAAPLGPSRSQKWWTYVGMTILFLVFLGLAVFLVQYANGVGYAKLATIEGTRPLLVVAAIISTIIFGGALLLGSLFSSEGTFEERFRHAREIFLVFSGIFGTVIGFYFGAGESKIASLNVDAVLQGTTLVAYATGGTPPYKVTIAYGPKQETMSFDTKTGWAQFVLDKTKHNIIPLKVSASDSKNIQGTNAIDFKEDELKAAGWTLLK